MSGDSNDRLAFNDDWDWDTDWDGSFHNVLDMIRDGAFNRNTNGNGNFALFENRHGYFDFYGIRDGFLHFEWDWDSFDERDGDRHLSLGVNRNRPRHTDFIRNLYGNFDFVRLRHLLYDLNGIWPLDVNGSPDDFLNGHIDMDRVGHRNLDIVRHGDFAFDWIRHFFFNHLPDGHGDVLDHRVWLGNFLCQCDMLVMMLSNAGDMAGHSHGGQGQNKNLEKLIQVLILKVLKNLP